MTGADNDILVGIITAADDNVTLSATNDITDGGTGKITAAILTATADSDTSGEGLIDVTTAVDSVTASAGETIDITEDDDITLTSLTTTNGTITVATVDGTITATSVIAGTDGDVSLTAVGAGQDILVGIITATDDDVTLSATNDITDGGTGKITAAILSATADSDTSGEGLIDVTTAVDSVTASAGETIDITEDDDITLTSLTTTNGTITVATVDGTITVAGAVSLDGNLLLDANGATSDINVNAATTTLGGTATLSADNSINFGASGSIDTDDGSGTGAAISLTADADTTGGDGDPLTITNGGAVIMADGSTVDAGDGEILIVADGDVRIGKLITTSSSSTAVTVTATSGNIVDGGEDDPDLDIDAAARGVVLTADGTIGEVTGFAVDPELEMNVGSLCINTGGDFILSDPDGIFVKEIIAGGNVSLTAVTYIDDLQDDTVTDITAGGTITLSAGTNIGGSPSAGTTTDTAGRLEVADGSDVTANADDVILLGANGAVTLTVANSTSSDVDVTASGTITATDVDADGAVTLNTTTGGIMAADVVAGTEVELSADAGDIQIGSVTSTGSNITVTATTGAITDKDADAAVDLTATIGSAILTAANGIGDADAIETSVEILDATNTVMGNIDINQTGELLIENIDQQGAGNVNVDGNDTITVDSSGSGITSMGGSVELDADGATSDINVDNTISSNGGAVNLLADNDVNFAEAGDVSTAGGNLTVSATGGQITMADSGTDTATIDAGAGTISLSADENIELGRLVTTNNTAGAVSVDSDNGAITDGGDTDGADIEATGADAVVTLNGATGIGDGDAIDLEVASVDVSNSDGTTATAAGNIDLNETDALSIVGIDQDATAGTVNVDAGGTITVAATPGTGISAVDGSVELDANGATSDVVVNNTVTTGAGAINLLADDDVTFSADGDVTSTSGKVTVTGDADNDATGSVTLADGSVISAGSGDIEVTANDDITLGRLVTTSNTATAVVVDSEDGAIIDGGDTDGTDIEATDAAAVVTLNAATGIGAAGANGAIDTSVSNLSITNSVRGNVDINETDALSIVGIDQDATAGTVNVDAGGTITVTAGGTGIDAAGGSVELDADGATSDINVDNTISSNGGAVNLLADNDVNFAETGDVSSADGNVTVSANADGVADGTSGQITMADDGSDTATINAGAGTISLSADENIELGRLVTTNSGNFAVTVDSTSGGVIDGGDTDGEDIAASSGGIVINAVTGVGATAGDGADAAIETNAGSLDIDNATSGDIVINETDAVTLFDVQQATAGNITINADGSVAVDNGTAAVAVSTVDSGTIEINANGVGSDLTINSRIQSSTGGMMLTADSDIDFTVNGDVTSTSGNVQITADTAVGNGGGKVTMDNEALINAGSGTIDIDADGDVTLGGLLTTSAANDAVTIDATSGGVVDGGDTFTDIDAANGWVLINAATGVGAVAGAGADPAIETNAATLDIDNSTSGDIVIDETDAVTLFDVQQATAGNITVNAGGTTTIDNAGAGIAVSTVGTGTVEINANGTGSNLVVNDGVSSVAGTIALTADDNVSFDADGDISSSTGNVVVEADADSGGAGSGGVTMTDGAVIDSGTGTIFLESRDTATIGRLVSSSTAVGTAITVISYSGAIADGGDSTGADIEATDSNAQVLLFADGGIGDGDAIETNVADLFFQNSGGTSSGVVNIIETDSITISGQNLDASEPINVCVLAADAVLTVGIGGLLSTNGVITLVADDMQITDTVDAGTADVNLRTKDAAQVIS